MDYNVKVLLGTLRNISYIVLFVLTMVPKGTGVSILFYALRKTKESLSDG